MDRTANDPMGRGFFFFIFGSGGRRGFFLAGMYGIAN